MEQKNDPGRWPGTFFSGKGFYIVLLLCGAILAMAAMLRQMREGTMEKQMTGEAEMTMAVLPTPTPKPESKSGSVPAVQTEPLPAKTPVQQPELPVWVLPEAEKESESAETSQQLPLYFIWPVSGVLERGYSRDELHYDTTMGDWRTHEGWDIAAAAGGQVLAAADGTVSEVYTDDLYGTVVEIDHGCGVVSCYANLEGGAAVSVGDRVRVGEVIGAVGGTALCEVGENDHLHFAMKLYGRMADPANWLPER